MLQRNKCDWSAWMRQTVCPITKICLETLHTSTYTWSVTIILKLTDFGALNLSSSSFLKDTPWGSQRIRGCRKWTAGRLNSSFSKLHITLGQSPLPAPRPSHDCQERQRQYQRSTRDEERWGGCLWSHHTADYLGRQKDTRKAKVPIDHAHRCMMGK